MATSDFGKAFAAARKAGLKTFEYKGKKYSTQTRDESNDRAANTNRNYGNEGRRTPMAPTPAARANPALTPVNARTTPADLNARVSHLAKKHIGTRAMRAEALAAEKKK